MSILNHEKYTEPLTAEEKKLLEPIMKGLKKHIGKEQAIKAYKIVEGMNARKVEYGFKGEFTDVRLRKIISYIRSNKLLPVLSGGKGYYVSYSGKDLLDFKESMQGRISAIQHDISGIDYWYEKSKQIQQTKMI